MRTAFENQGAGGKENKTPGDEHYLDPPGAELLAWSKINQAMRAGT
jgi:hypothetical protein